MINCINTTYVLFVCFEDISLLMTFLCVSMLLAVYTAGICIFLFSRSRHACLPAINYIATWHMPYCFLVDPYGCGGNQCLFGCYPTGSGASCGCPNGYQRIGQGYVLIHAVITSVNGRCGSTNSKTIVKFWDIYIFCHKNTFLSNVIKFYYYYSF